MLRRGLWVATLAFGWACASGVAFEESAQQSGVTSSSSGSGATAGGGGTSSSCAEDCTAIATPPCLKSVCNEGMYQGTIGECVIVPDEGAPCEDGEFCTIDDTCDAMGQCVGGPANDCGMTPGQCKEVQCDEDADTCIEIGAMPGAPCQDPNNLCLKGSTCNNGLCTGGTIDDCFFFPVSDNCHVAVCNPMNGMCEEQVGNEGAPCVDATDLCTVGKTCNAGNCTGGTPKDCSAQTMGCFNGVCDTTTGNCIQQPIMNGQPCNDFNGCTVGETCVVGVCTPMQTITSCIASDGCCPMGCDMTTDNDCQFLDVALAAGSGSCLTANNGPFVVLQAALQARGHTATFVTGSGLDSLGEISAYDVVVLTGPGDPCSQQEYATYDPVIAQYVSGGGGVVGSGWLLYSSYLDFSPNIVSLIPTVRSNNYLNGPGVAMPVGNHPIVAGLSSFNWNQYLPWGGGTKSGATTILKVGNTDVGAVWQQGAGRVVFVGPMFVEGYSAYDNENLLNGTQPDSLELFARAIEWAGGAL